MPLKRLYLKLGRPDHPGLTRAQPGGRWGFFVVSWRGNDGDLRKATGICGFFVSPRGGGLRIHGS